MTRIGSASMNITRFTSVVSLLFIITPPPSTGAGRSTQTLRQAAEAAGIHIGTAVSSRLLNEADYAQVIGTEFSQLEPENEMKFGLIHPRPDSDPQPYNFKGADELVAFAEAHHMLVRGHTLVWHRQVPSWLTARAQPPSQLAPKALAEILHKHIQTVVSHYAGKVYAWDVVNEAFNEDGTMRETIWYDLPGIGYAGQGTKYIEQALRWARAADRHAKLFYNDYDSEPINPKSDAIYAMAADFKKRGVPLDGIGFQVHVDLAFDNPTTLASFRKNLKRFAALGLQIHFTEVDIRLHDSTPASLQAQAHLYSEITKACVELSACKAIQTWGFTDKHSWIPGWYSGMGWALLWDADYKRKLSYTAIIDALSTTRPRSAR
jgi:endo-1,4-beta-xylanase